MDSFIWSTLPPSAPNFSIKSYLHTILPNGATKLPVFWSWDGYGATWDVETNARGPRVFRFDYPGAGNAWGMYYMPSPMDYASSVNTLNDGNNIVSFNNIHHNLTPRMVWNELFLKGVTGFMMIHGYTKYKDENNAEQYRYASEVLKGETILEDGSTDICGGVFLGCQSLKPTDESIPDVESLLTEAVGNLSSTSISGALSGVAAGISTDMSSLVNQGKRIDDIIREATLFNNWGYLYAINNGSVVLRGKIKGEEDSSLRGFIRIDGPTKQIMIHDAAKESAEAKYCKNVSIESSGTDYDLILLDAENKQITVKALKKIYLRTFQDNIVLKTDADVLVQANNIKLTAIQQIDICAGTNVNIGAGGYVSINGTQVHLNSGGKSPINANLLKFGATGLGASQNWMSQLGSLTHESITSYVSETLGIATTAASFGSITSLVGQLSSGASSWSGLVSNITGMLMGGIPVGSGFGSMISSLTSSIGSFGNIANQLTSLVTSTLGSIITPISQMTTFINNITSGVNALITNYNVISAYTKPRQFTKSVKTSMESIINNIDTNMTNLYQTIV